MIKIEELMKKQGVGVTELAERLEVNRHTVYYYIKQGDKNPISQLSRIADAIGIDVRDFFEENNDTFTCPHCGKKIKIAEV